MNGGGAVNALHTVREDDLAFMRNRRMASGSGPRPAVLLALALSLAVAGCSTMGGGDFDAASTVASTAPSGDGPTASAAGFASARVAPGAPDGALPAPPSGGPPAATGEAISLIPPSSSDVSPAPPSEPDIDARPSWDGAANPPPVKPARPAKPVAPAVADVPPAPPKAAPVAPPAPQLVSAPAPAKAPPPSMVSLPTPVPPPLPAAPMTADTGGGVATPTAEQRAKAIAELTAIAKAQAANRNKPPGSVPAGTTGCTVLPGAVPPPGCQPVR
jgi:hypothetical protein